jgi:hypothetical protein
MIVWVGEGGVMNMLLQDPEKLNGKELNDSTEIVGGRKVWIFHHSSGHTTMIQRMCTEHASVQ